ncbi:hypothetical protein ACQCSX_05915 [Pseudarthrobacter sp. P1]|uniref:hypothetical protein n=1 Tax=Pseudarthrobacter sp. P1 TaxID=3418418 RepID=UPI003CF8E113
MSKESEPIRSRRDLRRDTGQQEQPSAAGGYPAVPLMRAPEIPPSAAEPAEQDAGAVRRSRRAAVPAAGGPAPGLVQTVFQGPTAATPAVPAAPTPAKPVPGQPAGGSAPAAKAAAAPVRPASAKGPAAGAPAAAPASPAAGGPRERSSQTRARDRATLRAYKELSDPAATASLPSRRAMRMAQLEADRAPITSVNQIVPAAAVPAAKPASATAPAVAAPAAPQPAPAAPQPAPAAGAGSAGQRPEKAAPSAAAPAPAPGTSKIQSVPKTAGGPKTQAQAVLTPAGGSAVPSNVGAAALSSSAAARRPGTRTGRRSAPLAPGRSGATYPATTSAVAPETSSGGQGSQGATKNAARAGAAMTVEDALAARNALVEDVSTQVDALAATAGADPLHVDLEVLAQQRALAERAAILNRRAQDRERLAQESANSRPPVNDPTAAHNLAMVTPLEFIRVPGVENPVLRPPSTSHVPVITRSNTKQSRPATTGLPVQKAHSPLGAKPAAKPAAKSGPKTAAAPAKAVATPPALTGGVDPVVDSALAGNPLPGTNRRPPTGHTRTLKLAEAVARSSKMRGAARESASRTEMPPLPADSAHGLEPLDALTAGLARTQRNRLIQWGSVVAGAAALIAGFAMIITSLAH